MKFNQLFTKYLIKQHLLTRKVAEEWCEKADTVASPLHVELVKNGCMQEEAAYQALAEFLKFDYRFVTITELDLDFIKKYPRDVLLEHMGLPIYLQDNTLHILTSNPFRVEEFRQLLVLGGEKIKFIICPHTQMVRLIDYANNKIQQDIVLTDYSESSSNITMAMDDTPVDAPIIKLCDSILRDAINRGASDIHIEPFEKTLKIRFRIDGKLTTIEEIAIHLFPAILARYKIMAELNIAERRVPQDGKINMDIGDVQFDFRVSTIPTIHGEKIVIRIFNRSFKNSDIASLGFSDDQIDLIMSMITRPHGIILLTGPTGSGKSTTLYTFLRYLNNEDTNIITVEDPVENEIEGINQVQVNPKANLTFAAALRSFLRQDPNIIMIGEIRDEETAQIATRAAITGHLVLSSIHTNDASGVVTRLVNMGIPKYLVADSLLGSISQRLIRKLCPKCKRAKTTDRGEMDILGLKKPITIYEKVGCPYCNNTGYTGRIGIFEILSMTDEIRDIIMQDDFTSEKINACVERDMATIIDHAKRRVIDGSTTLEEYDQLVDVIPSSHTKKK